MATNKERLAEAKGIRESLPDKVNDETMAKTLVQVVYLNDHLRFVCSNQENRIEKLEGQLEKLFTILGERQNICPRCERNPVAKGDYLCEECR